MKNPERVEYKLISYGSSKLESVGYKCNLISAESCKLHGKGREETD